MKCSAYWVYYDIPHIYLFSESHIISYEIVENVFQPWIQPNKSQSQNKIITLLPINPSLFNKQ